MNHGSRVAPLGGGKVTLRHMPHPRNREYRPVTPGWLADEITLAGDLDGCRRVWRRFTNRIAQTGEATDLGPLWAQAADVLRGQGRTKLAELAGKAAVTEQRAPRKRARKTFKRITDEMIAGAVVQAGTVDGIRGVWQRYKRLLSEARQGDIAERWPRVLDALRRLGRPELVGVAEEAQRREQEAREKTRLRRNARARELRNLHTPARPPVATHDYRTSPALKVHRGYVMRVPQDLADRLAARVTAGPETKAELVRRYLTEGVGVPWGEWAVHWSDEFEQTLDGMAHGRGMSRNALIARLLSEGLARDGAKV